MAHEAQQTPVDEPQLPGVGGVGGGGDGDCSGSDGGVSVGEGAGAADGVLPDLLPEDGPDRHPVICALLLLGAVICFVLGVIGWLVPLLPGLPFYILAGVLAGMANRRAAVFINRHERRLPPRLRRMLRLKRRRAPRDEDRAARGG